MITLWRGNALTEIRGASVDLLHVLGRHLSVPVQNPKLGSRFGCLFEAPNDQGERQLWGSLVRGNLVGAGLTPHVEHVLRHYREQCVVRDTRERPADQLPLWSLRGDFRPYQDVVHRRVVRRGAGVVVSSPRSGKTRMAMRACDTLNLRTLYVAPSSAIVHQTAGHFRDTFGDDFVTEITGEVEAQKRDVGKQFVITTIASALRLPDEYVRGVEVLILDEFHHGASNSYHELSERCPNAYYRLCFTGTHFRTDPEETMAMQAVCSDVLADIPAQYLVDGGWIAPARLVVAVPRAPRAQYGGGWRSVYERGIVRCEPRNRMVAGIARKLGLECGISTLVLVRRRQHARDLHEMIDGSSMVRGGDGALTGETIEAFRRGDVPVLVGTTVVGEGVDLPSAGAVVYASGGGGTVQQIQSYYRPLTAAPGKDVGLIYDFMDRHHPTLGTHSLARVDLAERCLGTQAVRLW